MSDLIDRIHAPHSPGWEKCSDGKTCYAVLDGRVVDQVDEMDILRKLAKDSEEVMGQPTELVNGIWAGDFMCGNVLIVYYRVKEEDDSPGPDTPKD